MFLNVVAVSGWVSEWVGGRVFFHASKSRPLDPELLNPKPYTLNP